MLRKNKFNNLKVKLCASVLLCSFTVSCASVPQGSYTSENPDINPHLEPVNRYIYSFNQIADTFILQPIARTYRTLVPDFVQQLAKNFFNNFHTPVYIINYILQGEGQKAQEAFGRFALNTSLGFFGIADMASSAGLQNQPTDFGITMAKWGYTDSAYFVIPLMGPSTVRDTLGEGVDAVLNPFNIASFNSDKFNTFDWIRLGTEAVASRAAAIPLTDDIRKSLDPYTTMQSMYLQNRRHELNLDKDTNIYDFDFDMDEE